MSDDEKFEEEHNTIFPLEECHGCFFDDCHCLNQDFCFMKEMKLSDILGGGDY